MLTPPTHTDIFVSYAPADDTVLQSMVRGWVSVLVSELQLLLNRELGKPEAYSVWMPKFTPGHMPAATTWRQPLQQASVLLAIVSPSYFNAPECQRQLAAFVERVGIHAGRIFVVEYTQLKRTDYPLSIRELPGYAFWEAHPDGYSGVETLGFPRLTNDDKLYYQRLQRLVRDLAQVLQTTSAAEPAMVGSALLQASVSTNDLPAVFLAEVSDDLIEQRDAVKTYLQQHGIRLFPEQLHYFFPTAEQLRHQLRTDMQQCGIFVQLLSAINPTRPPGMPTPSLQAKLAAQTPDLQLLQWRSAALDLTRVVDAEQRDLLESLHIVTSGLGEFKQLILQRCHAVQQQRATAAAQQQKRTAAGDSQLVFINADKRDQSIAESIQRYLHQYGMSTSLPPFGDSSLSPRELREDLENNLTVCDAVIVLFGSPNVVWVRSQLLFCEKMRRQRDPTQPLKIIALLAEPNKPIVNIELAHLQRFHCMDLQAAMCIEQFLEVLRA